MPLSKPSTKMGSEYDVVVIGSGYGGGVAASRMSRAGLKVVVFEKGMEHGADDFMRADKALSAIDKIQLHYGNSTFGGSTYTASWEATVAPDHTVLAGTGLGGGSLINAAVMIRPEDRVFQDQKLWPQSVRDDFASGKMEEYYQRAIDMMQVVEYPEREAPKVAKSELFIKAARKAGMGDKIFKPPLAVSFEAKAVNHVGLPQPATNYSGDALLGNRTGEKNDMTKNYLPDAVRHGAEIFCGIEVQWIEENHRTGEYTVVFRDQAQRGRGKRDLSVTAAQVVLAAGTLGTSKILLRSKEKGLLDLNDCIGKRYTGNGAMVAYLVAGKGEKAVPISADGSGSKTGLAGVFIDTVLDARDPNAEFLESNCVIEDCVWSTMIGPPQLGGMGVPKSWQDVAQSASALLNDGSNTLPLMVLGHDDADAEIVLSEGDENGRHAYVKWNSSEKEAKTREGQRKVFEALSKALGGSYNELPPFIKSVSKRITAHPMGGCVMSDDPTTGAVNASGHVYRQDGRVHDGLLIADASIMPTSLGCNPALTITALAERVLDIHLKRAGRRFTLAFRRQTTRRRTSFFSRFMAHEGPEVEFTEHMSGHLAIGGSRSIDPQKGYLNGVASNSSFEFTAQVSIDDLDRFIAHQEDGHICGTASMPAISPYPLTITNGRMRTFVQDEDNVFGYNTQYELPLRSRSGGKYFLMGIKKMCNEHGLNCFNACGQALHDTRQLICTLYEEDRDGKVFGTGILVMSMGDVTRKLIGVKGPKAHRYKSHFMGNLASIYFQSFQPKKTPTFADDPMPLQRTLAAPRVKNYWIQTKDGEDLPLKRYNGGSRGVIICTHGLTTSDLMYSCETIQKNFVEACTEQGYDVWTCCLRFGRLVEAKKDYNLDDVAQYDYPAIFDYIEMMTDPQSRKGGIHVHGHCFGGMTFAMSVLGGHIAPHRVKSFVANQLGMNIKPTSSNRLKINLGLPRIMDAMGIKEYRSPRDPKRGFSDKVIDFAASYILPIPSTFRTDSVEQARICLLFNELWNSEMMDRASIERMSPDCGTMNLMLLKHVAKCVEAGHAVNAMGENVYLPNIKKLAQIPTTFQFGTKSGVFEKEAMILDHRLVVQEAEKRGFVALEGKTMHQLVYAEGHGHMDCLVGKTGWKTAYPDLIAHFAKWDSFENCP